MLSDAVILFQQYNFFLVMFQSSKLAKDHVMMHCTNDSTIQPMP